MLADYIERRAERIRDAAEPVHRGRRGVVSVTHVKGSLIAVKEQRSDVNTPIIGTEATYNEAANEVGVGPQLYHASDEALFREYVAGARFEDWAKTAGLLGHDPAGVIKAVFKQCYRLDERGVHRPELSRPHKDILVGGEPVIVDFERCRFRPQPANVLQFLQCVCQERYASLLGIDSPAEKRRSLREHAAAYKESGDDVAKQVIVDAVLSWIRG